MTTPSNPVERNSPPLKEKRVSSCTTAIPWALGVIGAIGIVIGGLTFTQLHFLSALGGKVGIGVLAGGGGLVILSFAWLLYRACRAEKEPEAPQPQAVASVDSDPVHIPVRPASLPHPTPRNEPVFANPQMRAVFCYIAKTGHYIRVDLSRDATIEEIIRRIESKNHLSSIIELRWKGMILEKKKRLSDYGMNSDAEEAEPEELVIIQAPEHEVHPARNSLRPLFPHMWDDVAVQPEAHKSSPAPAAPRQPESPSFAAVPFQPSNAAHPPSSLHPSSSVEERRDTISPSSSISASQRSTFPSGRSASSQTTSIRTPGPAPQPFNASNAHPSPLPSSSSATSVGVIASSSSSSASNRSTSSSSSSGSSLTASIRNGPGAAAALAPRTSSSSSSPHFPISAAAEAITPSPGPAPIEAVSATSSSSSAVTPSQDPPKLKELALFFDREGEEERRVLSIWNNETIRNLKQKINEGGLKIKIPLPFHLSFNGKRLEEERTLSSYGLKNDDVLSIEELPSSRSAADAAAAASAAALAPQVPSPSSMATLAPSPSLSSAPNRAAAASNAQEKPPVNFPFTSAAAAAAAAADPSTSFKAVAKVRIKLSERLFLDVEPDLLHVLDRIVPALLDGRDVNYTIQENGWETLKQLNPQERLLLRKSMDNRFQEISIHCYDSSVVTADRLAEIVQAQIKQGTKLKLLNQAVTKEVNGDPLTDGRSCKWNQNVASIKKACSIPDSAVMIYQGRILKDEELFQTILLEHFTSELTARDNVEFFCVI